ncbi:MAG: segregation/condensation protein A, partial [Firmicutes bacterium]|nr:segregation/condensation protein A [Bacillota bacterium]
MPMTFQLKDFDGPLDLLLHLVTKAQVDIRDIFVSEITDQYIDFVHSAADLDMEDASEFLVMAATLLEIKSRAMLPRPPQPGEEGDPEEELIRQLEEYRRFKETAIAMQGFENAAKALFTKLPDEFPLPPPEVELTGLTLEGLTEAFARIWARKPVQERPEDNHYRAREIRRDVHTVQECMLNILQRLRKQR